MQLLFGIQIAMTSLYLLFFSYLKFESSFLKDTLMQSDARYWILAKKRLNIFYPASSIHYLVSRSLVGLRRSFVRQGVTLLC